MSQLKFACAAYGLQARGRIRTAVADFTPTDDDVFRADAVL